MAKAYAMTVDVPAFDEKAAYDRDRPELLEPSPSSRCHGTTLFIDVIASRASSYQG
jgi:hypothetical protein